MTDDSAERAFRRHPDFEPTDGGAFAVTSTPFENTTVADDGAYRVTVRAPEIDAVVAGETVADVVADGWFETLERRLDDVHAVAETDDADPPEIRREGEAVSVVVEFAREDPAGAPDDAKAIVDYVEGTWVQGIIPGYDYREPAASLLDRATQNYDDEPGDDAPDGPSGAPPL
ncbi:DUF5813 family protein [Halorussus marinus]|uniref:DUF5813 family protein n=1 Tax=Halorussus marinus TaxID=2505976 RepID=UPI00106E3F37|nr:DUF5813 family protein [Halorussus marinus]